MPICVGDIVDGKYRVERELGEGGMGIVVAVRHLALDVLVAMKVMLPGDAEAEERFLREAKAAASLSGNHIAHVHDVGRLATGEPYMVMEYLTGTNLKDLIHKEGALPLQDAVIYMLQACEGLAEAHNNGIIHRDVSSKNIFLVQKSKEKVIKLLDFGIAKSLWGGGVGLTRSDITIGTADYMSPDQLLQFKSVDERSDIWSMGVVFYELITAKLPFSGQSTADTQANVLRVAPQLPSQLRPELPPAVDAVIECCLQKDPAQRYQNIEHLAKALLALTASPSVGATPPSAGMLPSKMLNRAAAVPIAPQAAVPIATPPVGTNPSTPAAIESKNRHELSMGQQSASVHVAEVHAHPALRGEIASEPPLPEKTPHHSARGAWRRRLGGGTRTVLVIAVLNTICWSQPASQSPQGTSRRTSSDWTHELPAGSASTNGQPPSGTIHEGGAGTSPPPEGASSMSARSSGDGTHEVPAGSASTNGQPPSGTIYGGVAIYERSPSGSPSSLGRTIHKIGPGLRVPASKLGQSRTGRTKSPRVPSTNDVSATDESYCLPRADNEHPVLVDLTDKTVEQRHQLIEKGVCVGDEAMTQLCCRRN